MSDQGLREALEKACKIAEARGRLKVPVIGLRELLAAHPAESVGSPRPVIDREALERLAAEWKTSADEDERYLNRAHASEIHDVMASIRINREHADAVLALARPSQSTADAVAVVGAVVLLLATGVTSYRRRERADAAYTAEMERRLKQDTTGDHIWDA